MIKHYIHQKHQNRKEQNHQIPSQKIAQIDYLPAAAGLQLCDNLAAGSVRCYYRNGGCAGSANGNCYPYHNWTNTAQSSGVFWAPNLNSGSINMYGACGTGYCSNTFAFSVRCVHGFNNR